VGKTELLRSLAGEAFEIINTDSMQVYRGMDIGTAKPPSDLRSAIPHHLIDICDPSEQFEVGRFVREADRLCEEIRSRDRYPLLCGGTAFYFYHFVYGLPETPPADPEIREELMARSEREGPGPLRRELERIDPEAAANIAPGDLKRTVRALEVYHSTGTPLSRFRRVGEQEREGYRFLPIGLYRPREELYRRIDARVEGMWREGLPEEVRNLMERGYTEDDPGMKGIGYREFFLFRRVGELTARDLLELIQRNSRRYAKRQLTFFRRLEQAEWYSPEEAPKVLQRIREFL
jgi:tRNA dimethylallyltransferase